MPQSLISYILGLFTNDLSINIMLGNITSEIIVIYNLIFLMVITAFLSFIIGKYGIQSLLYILKQKKILRENLSLDLKYINQKNKKIQELENTISNLRSRIEDQDIQLRLVEEV